jgi:hypothetical protein
MPPSRDKNANNFNILPTTEARVAAARRRGGSRPVRPPNQGRAPLRGQQDVGRFQGVNPVGTYRPTALGLAGVRRRILPPSTGPADAKRSSSCMARTGNFGPIAPQRPCERRTTPLRASDASRDQPHHREITVRSRPAALGIRAGRRRESRHHRKRPARLAALGDAFVMAMGASPGPDVPARSGSQGSLFRGPRGAPRSAG